MYFFRTISSFPRELKTLPASIKRVSLVMFFYYFGWAIIDPFFTIYLKDILGSYTEAAFVTALLYLFSVLLSLPMGDLADIISKKKLIRLFLLFYIPLGFVIFVLKTTFHFAVFRIYHAFNATGLWSSVESYVRVHSPSDRASGSIGFFNSAVSLAVVLGAPIGGFLVMLFGIKNLFYILSVFFTLSFFMTRFIPDHDGTFDIGEGLKKLFSKKIFRFEIKDFLSIGEMPVVAYLSFIFNMVFYGTLIVLPLFSEYLNASPVQIGFIYGAFALPYLFEMPFSIFSDRFDRKKIMLGGSLASIVFLTAASLVDGVYALFFISIFLAFSFAFVAPAIEGAVTNFIPRERIGELNGVYRSVVLLGASVGSLIIGPVADNFSIQTPFLVGALFMGVFFVCVLLSRDIFKIKRLS